MNNEETLTNQAIARIRRDVLVGQLGPASKLRVRELAERYEMGVTPIREALSKLGAEGLVLPVSNRGFAVPILSREDLADITTTRCVVEVQALRLAIKLGDGKWEQGIKAALDDMCRYLKRSPKTLDASNDRFDVLHLAFHTSLIAACGSQRLIMLHRHLYQQAFRYRAIVMKEVRQTTILIEEHTRLAKVVLSRRLPAAAVALEKHLALTYRAAYPNDPLD